MRTETESLTEWYQCVACLRAYAQVAIRAIEIIGCFKGLHLLLGVSQMSPAAKLMRLRDFEGPVKTIIQYMRSVYFYCTVRDNAKAFRTRQKQKWSDFHALSRALLYYQHH